MSATPTTRSLALMRSRGYLCYKAERWNSFARIRQDMFGFIDIVCIKPGERDIGLQTTTADNFSSRVSKISSLPEAVIWLKSNHRVLVHGWAKRGAAGTRKQWTCREGELVIRSHVPDAPPVLAAALNGVL